MDSSWTLPLAPRNAKQHLLGIFPAGQWHVCCHRRRDFPPHSSGSPCTTVWHEWNWQCCRHTTPTYRPFPLPKSHSTQQQLQTLTSTHNNMTVPLLLVTSLPTWRTSTSSTPKQKLPSDTAPTSRSTSSAAQIPFAPNQNSRPKSLQTMCGRVHSYWEELHQCPQTSDDS
jgi:hypothetical protein